MRETTTGPKGTASPPHFVIVTADLDLALFRIETETGEVQCGGLFSIDQTLDAV